MFIGCGFNFLSDIGALNAAPIKIDTYTNTDIMNGIFDHLNITRDTSFEWTGVIPTEWDSNTLFNADFNGRLTAGNLDYAISQISGFNIKRRKTTDFNWITLAFISITKENPQIVYNDNLAASGEEYEYAVVPVVGGIEGNYINKIITTNFDGVFLCDEDTIYRFYAGVEYGSWQKNQRVGTFEPYGKRYPVVVSNAITDYVSGQVSGTVLPPGYLNTGIIDRKVSLEEQGVLLDFLSNKKAKILKDWNGRNILIVVTDSSTITFLAGSGMGIANVSFPFVEIGDANNQTDLQDSGLIVGVN